MSEIYRAPPSKVPVCFERLSVADYRERMPADQRFVVDPSEKLPPGTVLVPDLSPAWMIVMCLVFTLPTGALTLAYPVAAIIERDFVDGLAGSLCALPVAAVCWFFNYIFGKELLNYGRWAIGRLRRGVTVSDAFFCAWDGGAEVVVCPWKAVEQVEISTKVTSTRRGGRTRSWRITLHGRGKDGDATHETVVSRTIPGLVALSRLKDRLEARGVQVLDYR